MRDDFYRNAILPSLACLALGEWRERISPGRLSTPNEDWHAGRTHVLKTLRPPPFFRALVLFML